jgi:hypothetical protein
MSFTPQDSALKLNKEQEDHVASLASTEDIKAYLASVAAGEQGTAPIVQRDRYSPDVLIELPAGDPARAKAYGKTLNLNGQKIIIEAESETALLAKENQVMRDFFAGQPAVTQPDDEPARDPATGRFVEPTRVHDPAAKVELELKFKRGEISAAEYLNQSGAIEEYLESTGVPIQQLRSQAFTQSWADATTEFLNGSVGGSWPGGRENMETLARVCEEQNLVDATDKVAALAQAYQYMVDNDLIVANPKTELEEKIASARSSNEVREALDSAMGLPAARHQLRGW